LAAAPLRVEMCLPTAISLPTTVPLFAAAPPLGARSPSARVAAFTRTDTE
jgi:hypothetical protein